MTDHIRSLDGKHGIFASTRCGTGVVMCGLLLAAIVLVSGCKTAQVTGEKDYAGTNITRPEIIYVTDFQLGAENIHHEAGVVTDRPLMPQRVRGLLSGSSEDPEARARELVELMANSLVTDLKKEGFQATRLKPGLAQPAKGWIITGVFTEVQEGNRLRRSMIGMGQGATDVQLVTAVQDLSHGPPRPVQDVQTDATSGKSPGGAATMALSPWGAAAKFVLAGHDLEKNIKQTASQIADRIAKRFEPKP